MIRLLSGDCRDLLATLPADSVQCVVTSPPYYGLRDYGTAQWDGGDAACDHVKVVYKPAVYANSRGEVGNGCSGWRGEQRNQSEPYRDTCGKCGAMRVDRQIGLEATPDEYLATMVGVFRHIRRVLRPDGTCWVNMGDSYATQPAGNFGGAKRGVGPFDTYRSNISMNTTKHAKPKDLLMMPARLALALQADGWWVRSDIIWHKPNPMPESCVDRPTSAHEHVFLLSKSARYYYDGDSIREQYNEASLGRYASPIKDTSPGGLQPGGNGERAGKNSVIAPNPAGRSCRNVWTIATHSFPSAHFATFPPALAERCIRAGTSERGCCGQCGKPWVRVTETRYTPGGPKHSGNAKALRYIRDGEREDSGYKTRHDTTTGWRAGCDHNADVVPCVVLDPFAGASTTLLVAQQLQRDAIGIELNHEYVAMGRQRIEDEAGLFADVQTLDGVPEDAERETEAQDCSERRSAYPDLCGEQSSLWEWDRELAPT